MGVDILGGGLGCWGVKRLVEEMLFLRESSCK